MWCPFCGNILTGKIAGSQENWSEEDSENYDAEESLGERLILYCASCGYGGDDAYEMLRVSDENQLKEGEDGDTTDTRKKVSGTSVKKLRVRKR